MFWFAFWEWCWYFKNRASSKLFWRYQGIWEIDKENVSSEKRLRLGTTKRTHWPAGFGAHSSVVVLTVCPLDVHSIIYTVLYTGSCTSNTVNSIFAQVAVEAEITVTCPYFNDTDWHCPLNSLADDTLIQMQTLLYSVYLAQIKPFPKAPFR